MGIVFEDLLGATLTLACVYLILGVFTAYRLKWLQGNSPPGLNTRKLFVMTLFLVSVLRFMSFGSMSVLNLGSVHFKIDSQSSLVDDDGDTDNFFQKATVVLFDFPDFCCVSAYVLLIVVWGETYIKARRHWLSNMQFKRFWIFAYFIFNIILYATQLALYSLLFIPQIDNNYETTLIYLTLGAFNLFLPCCYFACYIYLAIVFSGFPFSTLAAKTRLRRLARVGIVWTISRFAWGLIATTSVAQGWLTEARRSETFYSVVLVLIFVFAEVLPIMFSLQYKVIQSLSEQDHMIIHNNAPFRNSSVGMTKTPIRASPFFDEENIVANEDSPQELLLNTYDRSNPFSGVRDPAATANQSIPVSTDNEERDGFWSFVSYLSPYRKEKPSQQQNSGTYQHQYSPPSSIHNPLHDSNASNSANARQPTSFSEFPLPTGFNQQPQFGNNNSRAANALLDEPERRSGTQWNSTNNGAFAVGSLESEDRMSFFTASPGTTPTDGRMSHLEEKDQKGFWSHVFGI